MLKIDVYYDGSVDDVTPEKAEELKYKFGSKVEVVTVDTSSEKTPDNLGSVKVPAVSMGGKLYHLEGPDSLKNIVGKAIF